jgi:hypothetical protein
VNAAGEVVKADAVASDAARKKNLISLVWFMMDPPVSFLVCGLLSVAIL